jgi:putative oxidoreductase
VTRYVAHPTPVAHPAAVRSGERLMLALPPLTYALLALVLRLVMARAIFEVGQAMIIGPAISLPLRGLDASVVLPGQLRPETMEIFATRFAAVPLPGAVIASGFAYAEFLLPICLMIGFGTRIAALLLLVMTIVLQIYVAPAALWTTHVYWLAILLTLTTLGPGAISLDYVIRSLIRK